jgi:dihydrofolate reductase
MGRIILSMNITRDGCCDPRSGVSDPEVHRYAIDQLNKGDGLLFGRVTFQHLESFWPSVASTGEGPKSIVDLARTLNDKPKYVVSSTLDEVQWQNSILIKGPLSDEVSKLKEGEGKTLTLLGSPSLALALARLGLIDEYELLVQPIVAGTGPRFFEGLSEGLHLKLTETRSFGSGVVLLRYAL